MKKDLHDKINQKEKSLGLLEENLKTKEKAITELILNSETRNCDQLLLSQTSFGDSNTFNSKRDPNGAGETRGTIDFEQFLGQFESHKDELAEREKVLDMFLNKD